MAYFLGFFVKFANLKIIRFAYLHKSKIGAVANLLFVQKLKKARFMTPGRVKSGMAGRNSKSKDVVVSFTSLHDACA